MYPADPLSTGLFVEPKVIEQIGNGTLCVLHSYLYPIGGGHVGNSGHLSATPKQDDTLVFFLSASQGEFKNGVFFGCADTTLNSSSNGWWWDQELVVGNAANTTGKYWLAVGNDSTLDNFWCGFEYPPVGSGTLGTISDANFSSSGSFGTFLCIFEDDDATLEFDNSAVATDEELAFPWTSFGEPTTVEYKISY